MQPSKPCAAEYLSPGSWPQQSWYGREAVVNAMPLPARSYALTHIAHGDDPNRDHGNIFATSI